MRSPLSACGRSNGTAGRQRGFTYVALLFAVAISGVMLASTGVLWRTDSVREREAELLFIGGELQRGLESYFLASPQQPRRFPKSLEELLEDRRGPVVRRHLRRLYADPFTGRADWTLVRAPDGMIVGVHSSTTGVPMKRAGIPAEFAFGDAKSYRDWVFKARNEAQLAAAATAGMPPGTPAMPGSPAPGIGGAPLMPPAANGLPQAPAPGQLVNPADLQTEPGSSQPGR